MNHDKSTELFRACIDTIVIYRIQYLINFVKFYYLYILNLKGIKKIGKSLEEATLEEMDELWELEK